MKRILWIGGNHSRHLYYINKIRQEFNVCGAIIEARENLIPQPPRNISELDRDNFVRHFANRAKAEEQYFGNQSFPDCPTLLVDTNGLSSFESASFVESLNPDLALIFGCGLIRDPLFSALPKQTMNLHLGLAPRYRGSATLFWPFYFIEPWYAGSTFHNIVAEPDAGDIIHQSVPKLDPTDHIHDVACKTVITSAEEAIKLLRILDTQGVWKDYKQKGTGKNFLSSDFRPEHLRIIYNLFNDDMVMHCLEGQLGSKTPRLVRQF